MKTWGDDVRMLRTDIYTIKMDTPEEFLRRTFVDEILPKVGDVIEQVVTEINPDKGTMFMKYRVVDGNKSPPVFEPRVYDPTKHLIPMQPIITLADHQRVVTALLKETQQSGG